MKRSLGRKRFLIPALLAAGILSVWTFAEFADSRPIISFLAQHPDAYKKAIRPLLQMTGHAADVDKRIAKKLFNDWRGGLDQRQP